MSYKVLITFDLPDTDAFPSVLIEALTATEVVALGHYKLPEQTPPGAARDQLETDTRKTLTDLIRPFHNADIPVQTRLVFSSAREKAIDRIARQDDCDAILSTGEVNSLDRLFVALGDGPEFDRIVSFVADLLAAVDASVILFHTREETLTNATDQLVKRGVDSNRVYQQVSGGDNVRQRVVELEDKCDLLVIGEGTPDPLNKTPVLETASTKMPLNTNDPAFIIRSPTQS